MRLYVAVGRSVRCTGHPLLPLFGWNVYWRGTLAMGLLPVAQCAPTQMPCRSDTQSSAQSSGRRRVPAWEHGGRTRRAVPEADAAGQCQGTCGRSPPYRRAAKTVGTSAATRRGRSPPLRVSARSHAGLRAATRGIPAGSPSDRTPLPTDPQLVSRGHGTRGTGRLFRCPQGRGVTSSPSM